QSNTGRPMFKWWSPMSVGSWGLLLFGLFSFASFLGVLAEDGRLGLGQWSGSARRFRAGRVGRLLSIVGALAAFFVGSYTGVLLDASNQPLWSDTTWLGALFLASSASTGLAALTLLGLWGLPRMPRPVSERLERAERWAMVLELALLLILA